MEKLATCEAFLDTLAPESIRNTNGRNHGILSECVAATSAFVMVLPLNWGQTMILCLSRRGTRSGKYSTGNSTGALLKIAFPSHWQFAVQTNLRTHKIRVILFQDIYIGRSGCIGCCGKVIYRSKCYVGCHIIVILWDSKLLLLRLCNVSIVVTGTGALIGFVTDGGYVGEYRAFPESHRQIYHAH
jgi:hypothetical protein